jgi:hypothetical protein
MQQSVPINMSTCPVGLLTSFSSIPLNNLATLCGRMHHRSLHTAHVDEILFHNSVQIINNDRVNYGILLMISSLSYKDHSLTTIWDPGANMSLITHKAARKLGL